MTKNATDLKTLLSHWFPTRGMAVKIALSYALLGGLWILFSGWLLHYLVKNSDLIQVLENVKGWFYVAVTALMLGLALDRYFRVIRSSAVAIEESEARLRQAAAAGNIGLWDWDLRTNQVYYSAEWKRLIGGYEANEITNDYSEWEIRLHPDDRDMTVQILKNYIDNPGAKLEFEYRLRHKNGSYRWMLAKASILTDEQGRSLRMLGASIDVSERKKLEESRKNAESLARQSQKMEALGALAGGIAHDFNNILSAIIAYSEMAEAETENAEAKNDLREVLRSAQRAKGLVQQILAFSRRGEQPNVPMRIGLIIKEALKMIRASLPSTIEIRQNIVSNDAVLADPTQMHQVLMNLCTNAAYAMRDGGGVLQVSLTNVAFGPESVMPSPELSSGSYIKLSIEDTGEGIDPAMVDRIFDPFFTTKEQGIGTGLGLSVVHGIVTSAGGAIVVESNPGKGSAFHVFLPLVIQGDDQAVAETKMPLPGGKERILVVDDEPSLAFALSSLLQRLGYAAEYRLNGMEALEAVRGRSAGNAFDLVITDMTMPHLTGAELAKQLLDFQPDLAILICTGYSEKIDSQKAQSLGAQGLLMKPVALKDLAIAVREALDSNKKIHESTLHQ